MIPGAVHRSTGIYLSDEGNPGKHQLGDHVMRAMQTVIAFNRVPYLKIISVGWHKKSGRKERKDYIRLGRPCYPWSPYDWGKVQLGEDLMRAVRLVIASNGVLYLQMTVRSHSTSVSETEGVKKWMGAFFGLLSRKTGISADWNLTLWTVPSGLYEERRTLAKCWIFRVICNITSNL